MQRTFLISVLMLILAKLAIAGNQFYPLQVGWQWTYENDGGTISTREISGQTTIIGQEVFVKHYPDILVDEYYSISLAGDVLWHGSASLTHASYLDPPLVILKAGAQPGTSWTSSCQTYCDPEGIEPSGQVQNYQFEAVAVEGVSVPAGQFSAIRVSGVSVVGCSGAVSSIGLSNVIEKPENVKHADTFSQINFWFAEGVGLVQVEVPSIVGAILYLNSWTEPNVGTESKSWGSIKASYR